METDLNQIHCSLNAVKDQVMLNVKKKKKSINGTKLRALKGDLVGRRVGSLRPRAMLFHWKRK